MFVPRTLDSGASPGLCHSRVASGYVEDAASIFSRPFGGKLQYCTGEPCIGACIGMLTELKYAGVILYEARDEIECPL